MTARTRHTIKTLLLNVLLPLILGIIVGMWLLPKASAEPLSGREENFLYHVGQLGIFDKYGTGHLLENGYKVCGAVVSGITPRTVAEEVAENSGELTGRLANAFVVISIADLCPESVGGTTLTRT